MNGANGLKSRIEENDARINLLTAMLEVASESNTVEILTELYSRRELSIQLFEEWKAMDEEVEEKRAAFLDCLSFCDTLLDADVSEYFILLLIKNELGRYPKMDAIISMAKPESWSTLSWANPQKPRMKAVRRVAPNHIAEFISSPDLVKILHRSDQ